MSAPSGGYQSEHLAFHKWILTGDTAITLGAAAHDYTITGASGVKAITESLAALTSTPYEDFPIYDPFVDDEPMSTLVDDLKNVIDDLDSTIGADDYILILRDIDTEIEDIVGLESVDALVDATKVKRKADLLEAIGEFNAILSDRDAVNSSTRTTGIALLYSRFLDNMDEFRGKLELAMQDKKMDMKTKATEDALRYQLQLKSDAYKLRYLLHEATKMHTEVKKLHRAEKVQNELAVLYWDAKAYEFSQSALGAIGGVATIPAQPSPWSTAAGVFTALYPGIEAVWKMIF